MSERQTPREYRIVKGSKPCLTVESRPGTLVSMAPPPMGYVPPQHAFIHAASLNPMTENELRLLLLSVASFDAFLERVVKVGFDVQASDPGNGYGVRPPRRIRNEVGVDVGVVWALGGQLATLAWQPAEGELVFEHAQVTAYDPATLDFFHGALASAGSFDELVTIIEGAGFKVSA